MILLDRVTKVYGNSNTPAINRISLHIKPKEFVILVGTSGAGKSSLLKMLTREEKQTSGKIVVGGIDYDKLRDKDIPLLRRRIGVIFQDFKLLPNRTVFEPKHSWDIIRLLEKINDYGTTVVLTTHNVEIVNRLKRRVITLSHGKITHDQSQGEYRQ